MSDTPTSPGPWEESLREADQLLQAVEATIELPPAERELAVSQINAKRRADAYRGGAPFEPLVSDTLADPPRWLVADQLTGGTGGNILDRIPSGSVLDPPPPRQKRKPLLRCDRCGCWPPKGWSQRWCPTCCDGHQPIPLSGNSGP
jgi:hypothetical protein